ncbi:uncharacterized protein PODANS_7_11120 [Podospora anserina S mat+]|uniref:Podospora anserina S mat+ genomic DNA chromosome 7, supercontig 1 n=1 Tax=Podospora anserina (strain S / ATCC MYA-4624 / DSM 980 / FGSC 10383) TaxID=515849 RepID=B2AXN1_PODAN|nr:uncharacterized protein PODANS_7_11120 [Podospora anserina S mat+]CAP69155.1 unnamed protein product [Podospora anserina S mat+]CDP32635.1 Putative protein of unknown function [Podospora anserina S mat+]
MSSSSDTVTIARADLDLLLQRYVFINAPDSLSVSQVEYDQLKSIARKYENLKRNLLRGGVDEATVALLSQGDEAFQSENNEDTHASTTDHGGVGLSSSSTTQRHHASSHQHGNGYSHSHSHTDSNSNSYGHSYDHPCHRSHRQYQQQTASTWDEEDYDEEDEGDEDVSIEEGSPVPGANYTGPPQEVKRHQYERNCHRTLQIVHLAEGTTHSDITNSVRGGQLLDVYLRSHDRSASVSFLHAADAQKFYDYCRRNDLYIRNKRRQFVLPGHVAGKISAGASRNLVIMNYASQHTEEVIREDLDHIHNLVVIMIQFIGGNCHIELNSVHNAIYARTCMLSRMYVSLRRFSLAEANMLDRKYKGRRIQFDVDQCAHPYPAPMVLKTKEAPQPKRQSSVSNRFQLLNIDDSEDEENAPPGFRSKKTPLVVA